MNKQEIIAEVNRLRPFNLGDDPYRFGQSDTLDRVIELLERVLPSEEANHEMLGGMFDDSLEQLNALSIRGGN